MGRMNWVKAALGGMFGTVAGAGMASVMANPDVSQAPMQSYDTNAVNVIIATNNIKIFPDLKSTPNESGLLPTNAGYTMSVEGLYEMCDENPDICVPPREGFSSYLVPSNKLLHDINEINERVNTAPYVDRNDNSWRPIDKDGGVCRNYALTKKMEMIEAGYPAEALNMIFVTSPEGLPHAVMGVATTQGIMMMDSAGPLGMLHTSDYTFVGMTAADDPWRAYEPASILQDPLVDELSIKEMDRYAPIDDSAYGGSNPLDEFLGRNFDGAIAPNYDTQTLGSIVGALADEMEHPDVLTNLPSYMSEDAAPEMPQRVPPPMPLMRPKGL